jgi:hypothetical protein
MPTPIDAKHTSLRQDGLDLGAPIENEETLSDGGSRRRFQYGKIYYHPQVGAYECHGLILETYIALGEQANRLGYPITDESDHPSFFQGRINEFEAGELLYTPDVGMTTHFLVPQVAIKLADFISVGLGQGEALTLDRLAEILGPEAAQILGEIGNELPDLEFRRAFDSLSPDEIQGLVAAAVDANLDYIPPNFENFLEVLCPLRFDTDWLVGSFNQLFGLVETAYAVQPLENASVVGVTNPLFLDQRHLLPAPTGIGVLNAWLKGTDGSGCHFIDIEHAWLLNQDITDFHEDLPPAIPLLAGMNRRDSRGHGAGVLGVVAAVDNNKRLSHVACVLRIFA